MAEALSINEKLEIIKDDYGADLAAIICGTQPRLFKKWMDGTREPSELQKKTILSAYEVFTVLSDLSVKEAKMWLVSNSDYLYGIPAVEIKRRPQDVILAALNLVTRGEDSIMPVDDI